MKVGSDKTTHQILFGRCEPDMVDLRFVLKRGQNYNAACRISEDIIFGTK
jgi:hypothetical protein